MPTIFKNQSGQTLLEYLLLVALMVVATMGVIRVMNSSVRGKFAQVIDSIQGNDKATEVRFERVDEADVRKKDMSDFMRGSVNGR
jgi:Flp pilus assembly pilin Flp